MKRFYLILLQLLLSSHMVNAQKQDVFWCFGDSTGIYFNNGNAQVFNNSCWSTEASSSVCDYAGNILFYTGFKWNNGFYIWNRENNVMPGSNTITQMQYSTTATQGLLILPMPGDTSKYYLFSICYNLPNLNLRYHIIDMSQDSGRGAVISANNITCSACNISEKMQAVRHANGRDWWLFCSLVSGDFISYLISPAGVSGPFNQAIGSVNYIGQMVFSPNGDKMACADLSRGLNIFDFDRCTGILSNWIELGYPPYNYFTTFDGFYGCSFSPSGQYLYASRFDSIFQYDLLAPGIYASKIFLAKTGQAQDYELGQHKLGPDGKIYIANFDFNFSATAGLDKFLNVINFPDSGGLSCGLALYSFALGDHKSFWGLPNIPNYNLGALAGSGCDSLTTVYETGNEKPISIYPNPTDNEINISGNQNRLAKEIILYSISGTIVKRQKLPSFTNIKLQVSDLDEGIYFYIIMDATHRGQRGKICILH